MSDNRSEPAFVDTNVLVYAAGSGDPRTAVAQSLLLELTRSEALRTSTQVLQEFFAVVTRKNKIPLTVEQALAFLDNWSECPVVLLDYPTIREAAKLTTEQQLSFWDSLILVAARRSGAKRIYTEDLQDGQTILGVRVINPFR
jgi:predicted nucleic acid-binding protein